MPKQLKIGDTVQYKGKGATVIRINDERISEDSVKILFKATGESRFVRTEDLLTEKK